MPEGRQQPALDAAQIAPQILTEKDKQQLSFIIHWQGGSHTSLIVPRPLPANQAHKKI
jgi:hypothetical protein